jgi:beta-lactamase superfamily II metal-dependent hydrolase
VPVLLVGEQRTVLVDSSLARTPEEVIVPYLAEIGLGVGDVDEVIVSHADVAHLGLLGPNG